MARLFTIQHTTLTDSMGHPLVLGRKTVGTTHHGVLSSPSATADPEQQFRVSDLGYIMHQGLGGTNGLLTRVQIGAFLFVTMKPFDASTGGQNQIWSFQHVGQYTYVMLGEVLPGDPNPSADRFYLNISQIHPEIDANAAMVTLLRPGGLPDLWLFNQLPEPP